MLDHKVDSSLGCIGKLPAGPASLRRAVAPCCCLGVRVARPQLRAARSSLLRRHHGQHQRACSRGTRCRGPDETALGAQDAAVAGFREAVAAEQPFSLAMQLRSAGARAPVLRMVFRRAAPPCPADPLREMDLVAGRRLSQAALSCTPWLPCNPYVTETECW